MRTNRLGPLIFTAAVLIAVPVNADNQTPTVSPIDLGDSLRYQISVQSYDFGAAELPTLQSYAAGTYQGKWVLIAGRTNGLHKFENSGATNFPAASRNQEVWVID